MSSGADPHAAAAARAPLGLTAESLEEVLEVTRRLAGPFDLMAMLAAVAAAARQVLHADRASVWLHDPASDELVLEVATDIRHVRVPAGTGLLGLCARDRSLINVPDCYADPRFDPEVDRRSGYRTRCSLTLPLVDHDGTLVGVMQLLNRAEGVFGADDERLALALAAQCAVALQRARATQALIEGEKMRQELEVARLVQTGTLPATMPAVPGYDCHGLSRPATLTGGDTFDLALAGPELLVVLADATGHGIGPALSVTQMHAMLRMALRLGAGLESAFLQLNNLLAETLAEDRFITAFIGLLDPATHRLRYISAGQGPILHFDAAAGRCTTHGPTCFPLGALPLAGPRPASVLKLAPGDALALLSDGIYEYLGPDGDEFGTERVQAIVAAHRGGSMQALAEALLAELATFARDAPQEDDITVVLVKREAAP
jgi:phosphoserine phosphatase